jgi:hypothetical protein
LNRSIIEDTHDTNERQDLRRIIIPVDFSRLAFGSFIICTTTTTHSFGNQAKMEDSIIDFLTFDLRQKKEKQAKQTNQP